MSPVELGWSLDGVLQKRITAEDGVEAILATPVGSARAKLLPKSNFFLFSSPVINRFGILFPGDPEYFPYATHSDGLLYNIDTIFDVFIREKRELAKAKRIATKRQYITDQGTIVIEARAYDPTPQSRR